MINLLPPHVKSDISYARKNTILIRWLTATLCGIVGVAAVVLAGNLYINREITSYNGQVQIVRDQLAAQKLEETQKRIGDISSSFKLVNQVLSRQVLFSKLFQQVGTVMPPGAALQNLSIGKLEGALDLQAVAVDYQTATQIQVNLQDPANQIFEKADIVSIGCTPPGEQADASSAQYPCQVSIRALFAKNNPFTFVQSTNPGATP